MENTWDRVTYALKLEVLAVVIDCIDLGKLLQVIDCPKYKTGGNEWSVKLLFMTVLRLGM